MATLTGGQTIATQGVTAQENVTITNILNSSFPAVTISQVTLNTAASPPTQLTQTIGTFDAKSVTSTVIIPTTNNEVVVASLPAPTPGEGSGAINNIVVDDKAGGLIIQGTQIGTVTGVIIDSQSETKIVVGDAGTQLMDLSRSTKDMNIVTGVGNDTVVAGSGNDSVQLGDFGVANGGAGADTLIGGLGVATLGGGGGADSIVASSGGGMLIGEAGNDTMVGGAGKDVFIYTSGGGNDLIVGFDPSQDTLGLANFSDISSAGWSLLDVISRATVSGGNTIITMPDGSTVTVAGATGININWFTVK